MTHATRTITADPVTTKIFAALAEGEKCLCELKELIGIPQTWESYDLQMLEDLGAVQVREVNGLKHYSPGETRALWHLRRWLQRQEPEAKVSRRPVEYGSAVDQIRRAVPQVSEVQGLLSRGC